MVGGGGDDGMYEKMMFYYCLLLVLVRRVRARFHAWQITYTPKPQYNDTISCMICFHLNSPLLIFIFEAFSFSFIYFLLLLLLLARLLFSTVAVLLIEFGLVPFRTDEFSL